MKKLFAVILALALLCGCSQTEIPEENNSSKIEESSGSSSLPEAEKEKGCFENFYDFSGDKINYSENVTEFSLNYTLGWNLRTEGYVKIEDREEKHFGFSQSSASTTYSVTSDLFEETSAFCTDATY